MSFTSVRARTQVLTADGLLRLRFPQLCGRLIDAEYLKADQSAAFGFAGGLPFYAPICSHLLNEREVDAFIHDIKGSLLVIMEDGKLSLFTENGEVGIPKAVEDTIFQVYDKICASPGTLNEKGELVLDLKAYPVGPHYPVNLLLGNREGYPMPLVTTPKSALDALGRGSFRGAGAQQILATRYVLRPEENGEPANRQFYLVEDGKQIFYSADVNTNVVSAVCTHSQNRTIISYETACGLSVERTIFILPQENGMPDAVEVQRVRISNRTEKTRELKIIFTGMFGITAPDALVNDIVYANIVAESEVFYKADAAAALTIYNQPAYNRREKRFALLLSEGSFMDEFCTSASDFIGTGTLEKPELAVKLPNRFSRKNAPFFAMAKNITLHPEDTKYADSFTGMMETKEMTEDSFAAALERLIDKYSEEKALEDILKKLKDFWDYYPSYIRPKTGNARFDAYVGHNLPFQTLYQTYVSRAFAWTQKAYREIGFREIQDIYASMYYLDAMGKDDLVKELLSNWIRNVFPMGYANHNFVVAGKEPGVCSDDALWLVQAVDRYVRLSGDLGILLEEFDVAGRDPEKNGKRTLAETIENILLYSGVISTGVHGLPLLDHADWNDTLRLDPQVYDGPAKEKAYFAQLEEAGGKYGDPFRNTLSESVMNACLAKIAADAAAGMAKAACEGGMADLGRELTKGESEKLHHLYRFSGKISEAMSARMQAHAWKGDFFARCLINDGRRTTYPYLGAQNDGLALEDGKNGTYFLNSYSWPILAGIASEEQIAVMLDVVERELKTDAGLKLCTLVDFGRLGIQTGTALYFPGDRENGGVFKHAAMMAAVASMKAAKSVKDKGLAERLSSLAWFMIGRTVPYRTLEDPFVLKGNPRFCTQYNNSETGENIGPMLSGTASWLSLAVYEAFGIVTEKEQLTFAPLLEPGKEKLEYAIRLEDTQINVKIIAKNGAIRAGQGTIYEFDGEACGPTVRRPADGKTHEMAIVLEDA